MADSSVVDLTEEAVFGQVRELILALPEVHDQPVQPDTRFDALGLDSLDRLELLVAIEDRYGIALPDAYLASPTVGEVVVALHLRLEATGG